ncbi:unnamed protein product [Mycena citricolor]|uniref:NAD-dependent epimerase/dehydratase domain-containing protein n=1 Tax=Mycena citricolor TaxID=2018698 RepID=A0AAD2H2K3_9AGAR|nr:unnamed protein product [Mycena citricolor]
MKLIITGATGFVGKEILSQASKHPRITSIVTVSRSAIAAPEGVPADKFQSLVVSDYDQYTDEAKKAFAGAGACIWTVGLTPRKYAAVSPEEAKRISHASTLAGLQAIAESAPAEPFRFCYMSGAGAVRDQTAKLEGELAEFRLMRGDVENAVLAFASEHAGFGAASVRPGLITERAKLEASREFAESKGWPTVALEDCVATMLHLVVNGFEKDPVSNDELTAIAGRI